MSTIWSVIHQNFVDTISDSATGVNSLTSVTTCFSESEDTINLKNLPSSIYDGKYAVQLSSMNEVRGDIGTGILDFEYDILLQVAFELNLNDKASYHQAIQNLEELVRKRLDYDTWKGTAILNVEFVKGDKFLFVPVEELEQFSLAELTFRVSGRTSLQA